MYVKFCTKIENGYEKLIKCSKIKPLKIYTYQQSNKTSRKECSEIRLQDQSFFTYWQFNQTLYGTESEIKTEDIYTSLYALIVFNISVLIRN